MFFNLRQQRGGKHTSQQLQRTRRSRSTGRRLRLERLEDRSLLAGVALVASGPGDEYETPQGGSVASGPGDELVSVNAVATGPGDEIGRQRGGVAVDPNNPHQPPRFAGGVYVAAVDINHDGPPHVIPEGPGGGPRLEIGAPQSFLVANEAAGGNVNTPGPDDVPVFNVDAAGSAGTSSRDYLAAVDTFLLATWQPDTRLSVNG
jgi:hypothetical protein